MKRSSTSQALEGHTSKRKYIAGRAKFPRAARLLWRHVLWSSNQCPRGCHRLRSNLPSGDSEIEQDGVCYLSVAQEDVAGLEVSVDDT